MWYVFFFASRRVCPETDRSTVRLIFFVRDDRGKDEDEGIDPSYIDLGLFSNSESVFERWSDVLCAGNNNELKAARGAGV